MSDVRNCGTCKFYAQGKSCSYCANPKQTDKNLKAYAYYPFSCELHIFGKHNNRMAFEVNLKNQ